MKISLQVITVPHKEVWRIRRKSGGEENAGDEKGFTTSLWRAKHTLFLISTTPPAASATILWEGKNWKAGMRRNIGRLLTIYIIRVVGD